MSLDLRTQPFAVVTATGASAKILVLDPRCSYDLVHLATDTGLNECLSEIYGQADVDTLTVTRDPSEEAGKLAIPARAAIPISGVAKLALQCAAGVTAAVRMQVLRKLI